jgi:hypothetical protein
MSNDPFSSSMNRVVGMLASMWTKYIRFRFHPDQHTSTGLPAFEAPTRRSHHSPLWTAEASPLNRFTAASQSGNYFGRIYADAGSGVWRRRRKAGKMVNLGKNSPNNGTIVL